MRRREFADDIRYFGTILSGMPHAGHNRLVIQVVNSIEALICHNPALKTNHIVQGTLLICSFLSAGGMAGFCTVQLGNV